MSKLKKIINKNKIFGNFFQDYIDYLYNISKNIDKKQLNSFFNKLKKIRNKNKTIFIAGNGGSAANALTVENDLGFDVLKRSRKKPFKIFPLVSNVVVLTAISNDINYEDIFLSQLKIHFRKEDMLIVMSGTGNSINLIKAARWVKKNGGICLGILGQGGGKLKKICNSSIIVKTQKEEFGPLEDLQLIINHALSHWFQEKLKN
jgi:D-sedoheptulose 7-phosphate isomerase